jgi:hypothetical protein
MRGCRGVADMTDFLGRGKDGYGHVEVCETELPKAFMFLV